MRKYIKGLGFYLVLFLVIVMVFWMTSIPGQESKEIYSDLIVKIQQGQVQELAVVDNIATARLQGRLCDRSGGSRL